MLKRISRLRNAKINSVGIASVFQAGDTNEINMRIKVLADQRTIALYRDDEGSFNKKNTRSFRLTGRHAVTRNGSPKRILP